MGRRQTKIVAQLWGFPFPIRTWACRDGADCMQRGGHARSVHNPTLQSESLAGLVVDLTACAAVSAIRLDLLAKYWEVLVVMALVGALDHSHHLPLVGQTSLYLSTI